MSPASTGNTGKQDRPTEMIGVRDCKVAEKLPLLASHHNYYHLSRTHCIFHKNIVKSMAFVYLSWYGSSGDLNFLVPKSLWLLVSFLASFAHSCTYHFVPNTEVLKCCYFSLRRAATRGKDACGEVFLSTSHASSVSKKNFIILPSICKVAWFILSHKIYWMRLFLVLQFHHTSWNTVKVTGQEKKNRWLHYRGDWITCSNRALNSVHK